MSPTPPHGTRIGAFQPRLVSNDRPAVLVVEDDAAVLRALGIALTRAGFEVLTASNGYDASAICRERHVDVLIADFRLPDMRADQLFHSATATQPHLAKATLFITGDITEDTELRIADCGCPLLRKPFDLQELITVVEGLSGGRRSQSA